jgi:asparagine synthase (glutamine-hydrolysing)
MSAIFGIIDFEGRPLQDEWIRSMQTDLAHRGPDGQGLYREESVALGHMLLQVTPESVYDKSPYEEDGFVITANARLDERDAIMDRLGITGEERDRITDPLLLLRSFRKYGKDFVKDIYGDFAFAIWDKEKKELFCARDQMGVKPFLYYYQDGRFVFSTELKAIVNLPFVKTTPDQLYLRERTLRLRDQLDRTAWKDIHRLKAAFILRLDYKKADFNKYWTPVYRFNRKLKSEETSIQEIKRLLERVIDDHTRVKGNVGANLSGGLDSSSIVCMAAGNLEKQGKILTTVSSIYEPGFPDPDNQNEAEFIDEVINNTANLNPKFVYHSGLSFWEGMEDDFNKHFAPTWIYYYVDEAICRNYRAENVVRVLSGHPGDFTISNSTVNPFVYLLLTFRLRALLMLISKFHSVTGQSVLNIVKSKILLELTPSFLLNIYNKLKRRDSEQPIDLTLLPLLLTEKEVNRLSKKIYRYNSTSSLSRKELARNFWPDDIDLFEEDWDCRSSHYNFEVTYPFADRRLVEFMLRLPVEHLYTNGVRRGLMRKAMEDILPLKISERKDKRQYSPGHSIIFRKDADRIITFLKEEQFPAEMKRFIDVRKLFRDIELFFQSKNNYIFAFRSLNLFEVVCWVRFISWNRRNTDTTK